MSCPFFESSSIGTCTAPPELHIPSIAQMEQYCFRAAYHTCRLYRQQRAEHAVGCPSTPVLPDAEHLRDHGDARN